MFAGHSGAISIAKSRFLLLSDGLKKLPKVVGQALDRDRFGPDLDMTRLDLGKIEDVVDQVQQVVAGRLDGLGVLDLLVRQVVARIVGEQLGQDQRRIERRPQLVRHVGEEVRFVAAGLLQLPRLELHRGVGPLQIVALRFQLLGLLLQLRIGLFQLDLLLLEPRLGFLERPALFLQLLVRDAQLLALNLQLLGLALGFLKQILKLAAIVCRAHGDRDRRRRLLQQTITLSSTGRRKPSSITVLTLPSTLPGEMTRCLGLSWPKAEPKAR